MASQYWASIYGGQCRYSDKQTSARGASIYCWGVPDAFAKPLPKNPRYMTQKAKQEFQRTLFEEYKVFEGKKHPADMPESTEPDPLFDRQETTDPVVALCLNHMEATTPTFKATVQVDPDKVKDLLACAFDGGSSYWAVIDDYFFANGIGINDFKEGGRFADKNHAIAVSIPFQPGCGINIESNDDTDPMKSVLNLENLQKGFQLMAEKHPRHFADFMDDNTDATTGDVFLQMCLFGELVFG
jgi:hypothetical protein